MVPTGGKILLLDTISQNKLNTIENHEILRNFWKFGSKVLMGLLPETILGFVSPGEPYLTTH